MQMKTLEFCAKRFLISEDKLSKFKADDLAISSTTALLFFKAMVSVKDVLAKYKKLVLVLPQQEHYDVSILQGYLYFSQYYPKKCVILDSLTEELPSPGTLYVTLSETDLAAIINAAWHQDYTIGEELGIISLDDTPLKEQLSISVINTGAELMSEGVDMPGACTAKQHWVRKPFSIIMRNSF